MRSIKESDEYAEFQGVYHSIVDYVFKGGAITCLVGTKDELIKMPSGGYWTLFDGALPALEVVSLFYLGNAPDIRSLLEIDLSLRVIRMFDEENVLDRIGPGLPGSVREFFGYIFENRNRKE